MRRVLRFAGLVVLVVVVAAGAFAAYIAVSGIPKYPTGGIERRVEITWERVERGRKYASLSCISCHQDPPTGKVTGKRLMDVPRQFGAAFSKNITKDPVHGIGAWTDGEILYFLRTGVNRTGQYVPPWMPKFPLLSDDDLESIVAFLRSDDPLMAASSADPPGRSRPSGAGSAGGPPRRGPPVVPNKPPDAPVLQPPPLPEGAHRPASSERPSRLRPLSFVEPRLLHLPLGGLQDDERARAREVRRLS